MAPKSSYTPIERVREQVTELDRPQCDASDKAAIRRSDWWWAELLCAAFGAVLVIALCIVLKNYDGGPSPTFGKAFGSSLTLNTIIAILGTAAKVALLYPVAECVGQLKWIWFSQQHRALRDMATFDRASRGIWGGFELLWATRLTSIAPLGGLVLLFAVAFDPITQQLISYKVVGVPELSSQATVSVATGWINKDTSEWTIGDPSNTSALEAIRALLIVFLQTKY